MGRVSPRGWIIQIVTAWAFFLLPAAIRAETVDERLYRALHDAYRSGWMDFLMERATDLGGTKANLSLCLMLSTYGDKYERETGKLAFTSLTATTIVVTGLKWTVGRKRPEGGYSRRNSSFPSGHATAGAAMMTILAHRYPRYRFAYYTLASLIAFSRIYLGRHYPSDVLAGAAIGYLSSKGVLSFQGKILTFKFKL